MARKKPTASAYGQQNKKMLACEEDPCYFCDYWREDIDSPRYPWLILLWQRVGDVMGLRIMVVDDALFMRTLLRGILEGEGWEVVAEASDGAEAVVKYFEVRPDVTTMDIVMPKKSGIEALTEIVLLDQGAKVVMCTAMGQESLVDEAKRAGAKGYLIKPFDPLQVKSVIREVSGL